MRKAKIVSLILCAAFIALAFSCGSTGGASASGGEINEWRVDTDKDNGGTSTITMTEETQEGLPARSFTGNITNKYQYGDVYAKLYPDDTMLEQLKKAKAISFRFLGDGDQFAVKIPTSDVKDYAYFEYRFDTVDGQPRTVIVPIEQFMQPSWGKQVAAMVNTNLAEWVEFQTTHNGNPGPFAFKIWNFQVHTKGVPKEKDVLPKGAAKPAASTAAAATKAVGGDLGALEITLADNFQYGDGYQGVFADKRLMNGHKIVPGEKFTLKITYTASRDLEDVVGVGLVDTTPAASYWRPLTWKDGTEIGAPDGMAQIKKTKAGETVSITIKFTTVAGSTSTTAPANALVFSTNGEGKKGSAGSGKQKAVTFKFTEFVFTQD